MENSKIGQKIIKALEGKAEFQKFQLCCCCLNDVDKIYFRLPVEMAQMLCSKNGVFFMENGPPLDYETSLDYYAFEY
jgi:hypothetical protein